MAKGTIFNILRYTIMEENEKKNVYICVTESLCCPAAINTTWGNNFILQFLKSFVLKKNIKEKKKKKRMKPPLFRHNSSKT